jgi:hypothetical protein
MVVTTTTSADGEYKTHTGTPQEVLDVIEDIQRSKILAFGMTSATAAWAFVRA